MAWEDDDKWPEPDRDPESLERRRRAIGEITRTRQRLTRWAYTIIGILIVVVIVLATTR
ncbi:MAG: hypothetical protein AB1416_13720 [Actinomycetota bacterium]